MHLLDIVIFTCYALTTASCFVYAISYFIFNNYWGIGDVFMGSFLVFIIILISPVSVVVSLIAGVIMTIVKTIKYFIRCHEIKLANIPRLMTDAEWERELKEVHYLLGE